MLRIFQRFNLLFVLYCFIWFRHWFCVDQTYQCNFRKKKNFKSLICRILFLFFLRLFCEFFKNFRQYFWRFFARIRFYHKMWKNISNLFQIFFLTFLCHFRNFLKKFSKYFVIALNRNWWNLFFWRKNFAVKVLINFCDVSWSSSINESKIINFCFNFIYFVSN